MTDYPKNSLTINVKLKNEEKNAGQNQVLTGNRTEKTKFSSHEVNRC